MLSSEDLKANETIQIYGAQGSDRVSSNNQDCALQEQALRAAGCDVVRAEKVSGTSRVGRTELQTLLDFLRRGDTLVVTRIDRLLRDQVLAAGLPI